MVLVTNIGGRLVVGFANFDCIPNLIGLFLRCVIVIGDGLGYD